MNVTIRFDVGSYSGALTLPCDENEDDAAILDRAKAHLRSRTSNARHPDCCHSSWRVVSRRGQR